MKTNVKIEHKLPRLKKLHSMLNIRNTRKPE